MTVLMQIRYQILYLYHKKNGKNFKVLLQHKVHCKTQNKCQLWKG